MDDWASILGPTRDIPSTRSEAPGVGRTRDLGPRFIGKFHHDIVGLLATPPVPMAKALLVRPRTP